MVGMIFWSLVAGFLIGLDASIRTSPNWKKALG